MQGRHRSPVGIGQRIASEEYGHGAGGPYGSGYCSYGRGGWYRQGPVPRSQPYLPPPPPPPPSKEDILMEAGRLAAEYLVARGILPQSSLPPVWQQNGGSREFRGRERDREREREREGPVRTPTLDRISTGYSDSGHGRRWYADDYSYSGGQARGRGKRSVNFSRGHESDWGRNSGRNGWWMDRSRSYNDNAEDDEDSARGYRRRGADYRSAGFTSKAVMESEVVSRSEAVESGSDPDTTDGGSVRAGSSSVKDDVSHDVETESNRDSDVNKTEDMEIEQGMESESAVIEKVDEIEVDLSSMRESAKMDTGSAQFEDLLKFCRSPKVPTKLRSKRGSKNGQGLPVNEASTSSEAPAAETETYVEPAKPDKEMHGDALKTDDENINGVENEVPNVVELEVIASGKDPVDSSSNGSFSGVAQSFSSMLKQDSTFMPICSSEEGTVPVLVLTAQKKTLASTLATSSFPKSLPVQHPSELVTEASFTADSKTSLRSYSFTDSSSSAHLIVDSCKSLSIPEASSVASDVSMGNTFMQDSNKIKRSRDWYSDIISTDDYANDSDLNGKQFGPQCQRLKMDVQIEETTNQGKMDVMRLYQGTESVVQAKFQDGPLLPNSFKIRDLNLMGTPEITDIPDDPIHEHIPSSTATLQAGNALSVDFGLSIGGSSRRSDIYGQSSNRSKEVPVIDLEDDSPMDTGVCDPSKPRNETIYKNLDSFFNAESAVVLPDIQDGYGHAITDLLGSDITSCSAVAANINSPQPVMTLHGAEEMAGDDDSIYVSLGEIPIGFMDIWDAAPQEYGKFF